MLRVGVISSTHGIKGEVKVYPTTDNINRFKELPSVILDMGKEKKELEIENVKFFKQFAILKFKGYDDTNEMERYKGMDLLVTREHAVPLLEGEFFLCDLIGLTAFNETGEQLGYLTEVIQTGANDVFVIKKEDGKELLLPYIDQCILSIHPEQGRLTVHVLPGL